MRLYKSTTDSKKNGGSFRGISTFARNMSVRCKSLRITGMYVFFGSIWIIATDLLSERLLKSALEASILKGLFYVAVTAVLVYYLIYSAFSQLEKTNMDLQAEKNKLLDSEHKLNESEATKSILLDNLPGMAYRCKYDRDWTMEFVSEGCYELTGYKAESLLNNRDKSFNDLIAPKYQEYLWEKWAQVIKNRSRLTEEYELITASGKIKWVFEQGHGIYDENGNVIALEGLIIDITERKENEIMLKYINDHDLLTGIYNRRYFREVIARDSDNTEKRAAVLVNLRRFNLLNSTFGYSFGENLIKELAAALSGICSGDCQLFHISIDRFVFYVKGYKSRDEITVFCDTITDILNTSFASRTIGWNIGIVELENTNQDAETILQKASIAAENANENFISYRYFSREMEDKVKREAEIKNELAGAAYNNCENGLYLVYQPVVNLKDNSICGFEALARFRSEKLGNLSPAEFIPLAEETQLIVPLGKKIIRIALKFLRKLELSGYNGITMSVNISAIQLLRDDFFTDLINLISETEVSPSKLCLEITESIFTDNYQEMNKKLDKIRELGMEIAIDDFGTGYSSLYREKELNVNYLKVDRHFISSLANIDADLAITGDIISMAHKLGHRVIAEGVEHEKQKLYLIDHGCDLMQGYLFSKPLSEESALEILKNSCQRR